MIAIRHYAYFRTVHSIRHFCLVLLVGLLITDSGHAQELLLNENCTISILNRTAQVQPDGSWRIDNVPANFGAVRARATCVEGGIALDKADPIPAPLVLVSDSRQNIDSELSGIFSEKIESQELVVDKILSRRTQIINALVEFLRNAKTTPVDAERTPVVSAITLLGELRSIEAVPILVEYIIFSEREEVVRRINATEDVFPAVKALISIGRPSIPHIIDRLMAPMIFETQYISNAIWIIRGIEDIDLVEWRFVEFHLVAELEKEGDPKRRKAIEKLLNFIKLINRE